MADGPTQACATLRPHVVRLLTNSPTPYRNHQFKTISQFAVKRGRVDFAVWFTSHEDCHHRWSSQGDTLAYPHRFLCPHKHMSEAERTWTLSLGLLRALYEEKPSVVIVGGYSEPTLQAACALNRILNFRGILYVENHRPFRTSAVLSWMRKFFVRGFDTFVVPGRLQKQWVLDLTASAKPRFHEMPNVIDEAVFGEAVRKQRRHRDDLRKARGISSRCNVFLSVMRLDHVKAADLLVQAAEDLPEDAVILIAGDGPLKNTLTAAHTVRSGRVSLLGHCAEQEMIELLAISDWFVLPSRNDPYPLAVIEALTSGLPLLLSDAVGCFPEALLEGTNGHLFKAGSIEALVHTLLLACATSFGDRIEMGLASSRLAHDRFSANSVAQEFVGFLEGISEQ